MSNGDPNPIQVIFRDVFGTGKSSALTSKNNEIILKLVKMHILEMEDVLFHLNSAVMMPENPQGKSSTQGDSAAEEQIRVSGIKALGLVFKQFEFDSDDKMVISGHTDRSDTDEFNFKLSKERALNVLYLLYKDDKDESKKNWAEICYNRQKVEDYQQILAYFEKKFSCGCDPQGIDDKWGDKTKKATQNFLIKIGMGEVKVKAAVYEIDADQKHRWPAHIWELVYDLYSKELAEALEISEAELEARRKTAVKFIDDEKMIVACGESFPIDQKEKDHYYSQKDRRVELLFFDKDEAPDLTCPAQIKKVHKEEECPLWRKFYFVPLYIDPDDLKAVAFHLQFVYYDRIKKKQLHVPAGLTIKAYEDGHKEIPSETVYKNGIYYLKVKFKNKIKDPARTQFYFEYETTDKWVFTKDDKTDPVIVTKTYDEIKKLTFVERQCYYDLPVKWSSRNYWTRYNGDFNTGERFEKVFFDNTFADSLKLKPLGDDITKKDKPLVFSLEDIVLIDKDGRQNINDPGNNSPKDKDKTDNPVPLQDDSRYSLFYVKDEDLILFDPEDVNAPYFSNYKFKSNRIINTPADGIVRMIAFANDFYSVSDKRSENNDKFKSDNHILGCRAAIIGDTQWHQYEIFNDKRNIPAGHNNLYFVSGTGNFELHYIHNGCSISKPAENGNLNIRSFLLIYWNGVFEGVTYAVGTPNKDVETLPPPAAANTALTITAAHVKNYETLGLKNAKERWENKRYTIEPLNPPKNAGDCIIQIQPVFFFEAKKNNLGGKPKCSVKICNDKGSGWMGVDTSEMYHPDYQIRDYLNVGEYKDIDGGKYKTLVVSHELGHAEGKDDEYAYHNGEKSFVPSDGKFSQYYPGMPYLIDSGSMMVTNRAPRMKHLWFFANWLNNASKDNNKLKGFLSDCQFRILNRFMIGTVKYDFFFYLGQRINNPAAASDYDFRNIYKPVKSEDVNTGTSNASLSLYKIGSDEAAYDIKVGGLPTAFAFDGILVIYLKISLKFTTPAGAAKSWTDDVPFPGKPGYVWKRKFDWKGGLKQQINNLNNRFYLQNKVDGHLFKNTYISFFPVFLENAPENVSHFVIEVVLDDTSEIKSKSGKNLKVGNNVSKLWITKYIIGQNDGAVTAFFKRLFSVKEKPVKEHLEFIEKWHENIMVEKNMDNDFKIVGN